jgi:hypothetical protein
MTQVNGRAQHQAPISARPRLDPRQNYVVAPPPPAIMEQ